MRKPAGKENAGRRPAVRPVRRPAAARTPVRKAVPLTEAKPAYPMRINKYLAMKGHSTRRDADVLIEKKQVFINGAIASLGDRVAESDTVEVRRKSNPPSYAYVAFNKPAGMDTHREGTGTRNIFDSLPTDLKRLKLFPVGRLDQASRGLIILTNDGRVTDRLLNPKHAHEKTYEVRTKGPLRASFKEKMEAGVDIEGYLTKPAKVAILGSDRFRITITEGKPHQIRRMVGALFNEVADLKRTMVMEIKLGPMKEGGYRVLEGTELAKFLSALGLGA